MGDGQDYQTKAEVLVLITAGLQDYERNVVEPRHRENQSMLRSIVLLLVSVLAGLAVNVSLMLFKH